MVVITFLKLKEEFGRVTVWAESAADENGETRGAVG